MRHPFDILNKIHNVMSGPKQWINNSAHTLFAGKWRAHSSKIHNLIRPNHKMLPCTPEDDSRVKQQRVDPIIYATQLYVDGPKSQSSGLSTPVHLRPWQSL